jgi:hypothetical protein
MVIVRLHGGLGNQLFQYSAARGLAQHLGTSLWVERAHLRRTPGRDYRLGVFSGRPRCLSAPLERLVDHLCLEASSETVLGEVSRVTRRWGLWQLHRERTFGFDPSFWRLRGNIVLDGYWQSERYFAAVADHLRCDLRLDCHLSEQTKMLAERIVSSDSVSVHVRRGDYVSDKEAAAVHALCGSEYYAAAADHVCQRVRRPHFFVFSDEPEWARAHLRLPHLVTVVDHNGPGREHEDLWLMSTCRHHVIANSTFSWWGAWLGQNPQRLVVAPRMWFHKPGLHTQDLLPERWVQL